MKKEQDELKERRARQVHERQEGVIDIEYMQSLADAESGDEGEGRDRIEVEEEEDEEKEEESEDSDEEEEKNEEEEVKARSRLNGQKAGKRKQGAASEQMKRRRK